MSFKIYILFCAYGVLYCLICDYTIVTFLSHSRLYHLKLAMYAMKCS